MSTQLQYVNIHGQPITHLKRVTRPRQSASDAPRHMGWRAVGFSPEQILKAREDHERAANAAEAAGSRGLAPFDEDRYMRTSKPQAIRSKPYSLLDAAEIACQLATKAGWRNCRPEEVIRN